MDLVGFIPNYIANHQSISAVDYILLHYYNLYRTRPTDR